MVMKRCALAALAAVVLSSCNLATFPFLAGTTSHVSSAAAGANVSSAPTIGGCPVFPSNSPWNEDVSKLPVRSDSAAMINAISATGGKTMLHADFGGDGAYGIPFIIVPATEKKEPIHYTAYGDESSPGPFPIPPTAPVEGGAASTGDRHVLVVQRGTCHLYELYDAFWRGTYWDAGSGVNWNLTSNKLRPLGWTSADAAGLPIFPGLARYGETATGTIDHALRFTVAQTQRGYIFPATHYASSSTNPDLPPMGLRLRLKASYSLARFHGEALVILEALKKYGMIVADNGSSWYISGAADPRWNDNDLDQLKTVPGSAFEAVNTGPIHH
ncbi:MAG: hypothetical protein ACLPVY_23525 [Acidimicrobiia bacterium]